MSVIVLRLHTVVTDEARKAVVAEALAWPSLVPVKCLSLSMMAAWLKREGYRWLYGSNGVWETRMSDLVTADPQPPSLLSLIVTLAKDQTVDVAKLQALLEMQERMEARDAVQQFNRAFIELQKVLPRIKKNGVLEYPIDKNKPDGPKRKIASFARWEDIDREIRPLLEAHGFSLGFTTSPRQGEGGGLICTAILRHSGGHMTETSIPVPLDTSGGKNNIQGYGSALSYGKRYTTTAALNLITEGEDDDGVRGGMSFITADQVAELEQLLAETQSDEARFLQFFGVAHLGNLTADNLAPARNMLLAKRRPK